MSAKFSSLRKRLAKLEQEQANRARAEELADCNCPEFKSAMPFLAISPEAFQAETNKTCPVHRFRRLGSISSIVFVEPNATCGGARIKESAKLLQLIDEYELRLAQHSQTGIAADKENDSKET
jgi:hypothetical protein